MTETDDISKRIFCKLVGAAFLAPGRVVGAGLSMPFLASSIVLETGSYFGRSTTMSGVIDSTRESTSFWFQPLIDTTSYRTIKTDTRDRCKIELDSSKRLRVTVGDGKNSFSFRTTSTFLPSDPLTHIAFWYDTNFAAGMKQAVILRNGMLDVESFADASPAFTPIQTLGQYFGATSSGVSGCGMVLREYMSWPGVKINWQDTTTLTRAYVNVGANGELVTGTAPAVYLSLRGSAPGNTFLTNRGTGGDFTQVAGTTLRADLPLISYGDSLTFGTGSSVYPSKTWVYQLARGLKTPRRRINQGIGGESLIAITGHSSIKSRLLAAVSEQAAQFPKAIYTLEGGYNNLSNPAADIITAGRDCVNALIAANPAAKWIFIGIPNGHLVSEGSGTPRFATLTAVNNAWAAAFGDRFLDIRRWLIDNGPAAAGLIATPNDNADAENEIVQRSLRAPDGSVHWNDFGQTAVYEAVKQKLQMLGYD